MEIMKPRKVTSLCHLTFFIFSWWNYISDIVMDMCDRQHKTLIHISCNVEGDGVNMCILHLFYCVYTVGFYKLHFLVADDATILECKFCVYLIFMFL